MEDQSLCELVKNAGNGCRDSFDRLSVRVQDELYSYIFRLTLNEDLTNDIRQETLLQMYQSLKDLQKPDRFKPWLYKIAWTKTKNHYRAIKNKKYMSLNDADNLIDALKSNSAEGIKTLVSREIAETLVKSIAALDFKQRTVLVLRCYENLSYSEIASILNCSETTTRVLFFRAKNNLKTALRKKGIVTNAMFIGVLGLFGNATSPTKAAVNVCASSLEIGTIAAAIAFLTGKAALILLSLVTAGLISAVAFFSNASHSIGRNANESSSIKSFHYIEQEWKKSYLPNANLRMGKSLSKGGYEKWYFFPEGVDGPVFWMMQRWDPAIKNKLCGWLLNGDGLKYYHAAKNTIYLETLTYCRLRTLRFPCDSPEFTAFLDKLEGENNGVEYERDPKTGLQIKLLDKRFSNAKNFSSDISFDVLDEKTFDTFRYKWPNAPVVDTRDDIQKTGWTSFTISGTIQGYEVHGFCRIPFVYNKSKEYPPLLKLHIGTEGTLIDSPAGAYILNSKAKAVAWYPAGTFFRAFMRPWFGMHTIDIIRRDAASNGIPFTLAGIDYNESTYGYKNWQVTLYEAPAYKNIRISLLIDSEKDRIESINFNKGDVCIGNLQLRYPSRIKDLIDMAAMPAFAKKYFLREKPLETLWLFKLTELSAGD